MILFCSADHTHALQKDWLRQLFGIWFRIFRLRLYKTFSLLELLVVFSTYEVVRQIEPVLSYFCFWLTSFGLWSANRHAVFSLESANKQRFNGRSNFVDCLIFKLFEVPVNILDRLIRKSLLVWQVAISDLLKRLSALNVRFFLDYFLILLEVGTEHVPIPIRHQTTDPLIDHGDLLLVKTAILRLLSRKRRGCWLPFLKDGCVARLKAL